MARESKYEGSEHESASEIAKRLCDHLFDCLPAEHLSRKHFTKSTCGAYIDGRKASLYWLYHQDDKVLVYPYSSHIFGLSKEIQELLPIGVKLQTRRNLESDWAKVAPYFFEVLTEQQARGMGPLLSYLAALGSETSRRTQSVRDGHWRPHSESEDTVAVNSEEGNRVSVLVNKYERSRTNRDACIREYGAWCRVCDFDFAKAYGEIGEGYIHVHHLTPLAALDGKARKIDPIKDMLPVCPNCHEMLHQCDPPYTIDQLREIIANAKVYT